MTSKVFFLGYPSKSNPAERAYKTLEERNEAATVATIGDWNLKKRDEESKERRETCARAVYLERSDVDFELSDVYSRNSIEFLFLKKTIDCLFDTCISVELFSDPTFLSSHHHSNSPIFFF